MDEAQTERELTYQADRAKKLKPVSPTPAYVVARYRESRHWRFFPKELAFRLMSDIAGKHVLDFGCGEGEVSTQLALLGAQVTAMDISPDLIEVGERRAQADGVRDRIRFVVGDILESPLPRDQFDYILCYAVIHHVDIPAVVPVLLGALKEGGTIIFAEPTALPGTLQGVRDLLPIDKDAGPSDHPLTPSDMRYLREVIVTSTEIYYSMFGRLERFFPNRNRIDRGHPFTKASLVFLNGLDRVLLTVFPFLSRLCGMVVLAGRKPASRAA